MWDPLGTHLVLSKIPCADVHSPIPETGNWLSDVSSCTALSTHAACSSISDGVLALIHMQRYRQYRPTQELAG